MNKVIYLDAAASALKPESVVKAEMDFLRNKYANAGRGVCARASAVDDMVADVRKKVARFINADENQIVFTSGATDGLNRIVNILQGQTSYNEKSTVAFSDLDHHSARVPWVFAERVGKKIVCELDENFDIKLDAIPKTDYLIITAMSNVIGRAQDVASIISHARKKNPNVVTIVDASQYVVHEKIDVKKWDCDFLVFSGHKIGADTGVGVLYIRDTDEYSPDKFGGGMVEHVDEYEVVVRVAPDKWESGTLPLTQISGLGIAIRELEKNRPNLDLIKYIYDELSKIPRIKIITKRDSAILSFIVYDMHPLDVGVLLGAHNICIRTGNMCASWIHNLLGINGSVRVSVGNWNTMQDAIEFVDVMKKIVTKW